MRAYPSPINMFTPSVNGDDDVDYDLSLAVTYNSVILN